MPRKKPWFTRITRPLTSTVNWICAGVTPEGRSYYRQPGQKTARMVVLTTDLDGRDVVTLLTPNEARALAYRLVRQAAEVDGMNATEGGADYTGEAPWVTEQSGAVCALGMGAMEHILRDVEAAGLLSTATLHPATSQFFDGMRDRCRALAAR